MTVPVMRPVEWLCAKAASAQNAIKQIRADTAVNDLQIATGSVEFECLARDIGDKGTANLLGDDLIAVQGRLQLELSSILVWTVWMHARILRTR